MRNFAPRENFPLYGIRECITSTGIAVDIYIRSEEVRYLGGSVIRGSTVMFQVGLQFMFHLFRQ